MKNYLIIVLFFIACNIQSQTVWNSSLQNTNSWGNSGNKNVAIRNLIKSDYIQNTTIKIAFVLKGRDDRPYTINNISFAQRKENSLDIIGNLIPVTFNDGQTSVTVNENTTVTSDPISITLIPGGKDFFFTFSVPDNKIAEQKGNSSAEYTSWISTDTNDATEKNWNDLTLTNSRHVSVIHQIISLERGNNHSCNFIIKRNTEPKTIDARKLPYSNIQAGDTICFAPGIRESLKIRNFHGTSNKPIIFINQNGLVDISTEGSEALTFQYCQYFRLTGTGDMNHKYGIKISKSNDKGIRQERKSNNSEIDHIEFRNIGTFGSNSKGIGYAPNVKSTCPDGYNAGYDYNNDGKEDELDIVSPEKFAMENILFHDNYMNNIAHEGIYLGVSFYHELEELKCKNGKKYQVYDPEVKHVEVYNNIIESTGWEPIQVASATSDGCFIHHNTVKNGSLEEHTSGQSAGIKIKPGSKCDVYNNLIVDDRGPGIYFYKSSGKVYNNVIVRPGIKAQDEWGQSGIVFFDSLPPNRSNIEKIYAFNNTIIQPRQYGIKFNRTAKLKDSIRIYNNLIVNPKKSKFIDFGSGYTINSTHHNIKANTIEEVSFINPEADNYELNSSSPAINSGINLSSYDITFDFKNNSRINQGTSFDIGAYEFLENTMSTENNFGFVVVKIYPNPTKNKITIKLKEGNALQLVKIYNNYGVMIMKSKESTVNISTLPSGIYFLQVITSQGKGVKKIIIN